MGSPSSIIGKSLPIGGQPNQSGQGCRSMFSTYQGVWGPLPQSESLVYTATNLEFLGGGSPGDIVESPVITVPLGYVLKIINGVVSLDFGNNAGPTPATFILGVFPSSFSDMPVISDVIAGKFNMNPGLWTLPLASYLLVPTIGNIYDNFVSEGVLVPSGFSVQLKAMSSDGTTAFNLKGILEGYLFKDGNNDPNNQVSVIS